MPIYLEKFEFGLQNTAIEAIISQRKNVVSWVYSIIKWQFCWVVVDFDLNNSLAFISLWILADVINGPLQEN